MPAFVGQLTNDSSYDDVAHAIIAEAKRRGHTRDEAIGEVADGIQESQLNPKARNPAGPWDGIYQQDGGYPGRFDANTQITGFMDRLDVKRTSPGHGDIWLNIFWLQQRPSEPSAQQAYDNGRQGYLTEIKSRTAEATRLVNKYWDADTPAPAPLQDYGVPNGSQIDYGQPGFPDWVYALGNQFGLQASTYPGHQETDRIEDGYARNPELLNRGIDWAGSVDTMQRFAEYLLSIRGNLEQVIWKNPNTGQLVGVAGGQDVTDSAYYGSDYDNHTDHVHTRQSKQIPAPGGSQEPAVDPNRPDFNEYPIWLTGNSQSRNGTDVDLWLLHTEQGHFNDDNAAVDLRNFLESSKGSNNPVSYHYTGRTASDGGTTVIDCVDTDLASWSVGNSNNRAINFCFAGSDVGWTREDWLAQKGAISAAAYLFVQDAAKYPKLKVAVIADPYSDPPGAADHNYCTEYLKDGNNHNDVGPNFPWDVFKAEVAKYSVGAAPEPVSPPQPSSAPTGTPPDYAKLAYEQLGGLIDPATGLATGWPQLGRNGQGQNLTVVDALAGLIVRVHNLEAALAAQTPLPAPKPAGGKPAAKKTPAKKAPAKKTATRKAPKK